MEKNRIVVGKNLRQYGMVIALASIIVLFQILTQGILLMPINITNVILQNSYIMVLSIGMLLCVLTGNIDLSVGSVAAFISSISGVLIINYGMDTMTAVFISLLIGAAIGAWHGFWIAYVRIPAFIVTLAGQLIFRGLTMVILQGQTLSPFPNNYQLIGSGFVPDIVNQSSLNLITIISSAILIIIYVFSEIVKRRKKSTYGIETGSVIVFIVKLAAISIVILLFSYSLAAYKGMPTVLVLIAVLIMIYGFITKHTVFGRHIYAFGGNEKSAKLSGVKTNKVFFLVYVNMGLLAALAGFVYASRLNAATPKAGVNFELDAIAACYIGGASASGGVGTIAGAIVGSLVMGVLNNGMSIMGVGIDWQQAIKGLVLLLAVVFDTVSKNKVK